MESNEKITSFDKFIKDYQNEFLNGKPEKFLVKTEDDMIDVIYQLYNTDKFDIDYEFKTISVFN